jgi:glycosyltransferase involved in cell wall biosynthesis
MPKDFTRWASCMRILYSHRVQSHDGQSVHIDELVAAFREAGHEVIVVGPSFYEKTSFGGESRLIQTIRRVLPGFFAELAELIYNLPAFFRLWRVYRSFSPDFVYERYNLYYLCGMLLKRFYRVPFCLEINSPIAEERSRFGALRLRWLARLLEHLVWRSADKVFVVTAVLGEMAVAAGVPPDRITVIPNGVERGAFPPEPYKAAQQRSDDPVVIGFVGFVREWHGLGAVVSGLASDQGNPPIQLVVVGPLSPDLERQAQALRVADRVRFTGLQQRGKIPDVIRSFDIALQPRAVGYASPLKLFEYMACGRAIIAPNQPNIREILTDGQNAILFDPEEPGALWRAIRRLAADPEMRERLGNAARRTLDDRDYSWAGNASKVINVVTTDLARHDAAANGALSLDRSVRHESR